MGTHGMEEELGSADTRDEELKNNFIPAPGVAAYTAADTAMSAKTYVTAAADSGIPAPDETLTQREIIYGDFRSGALVADNLLQVMQRTQNWNQLPAFARIGLTHIAVKISRMLTGNFMHSDNAHDIGGYARLIEENIEGLNDEYNEFGAGQNDATTEFGPESLTDGSEEDFASG